MANVWYKSFMFSKRVFSVISALAVLLFALCALSACEPNGKAVGNTGRVGDIIHDGVDINDIHLLVVGSGSAVLDADVFYHCKMAGLSASYASVNNFDNANEASQKAIRAASEQPVSLILINAFDVTSTDNPKSKNKSAESESWISALKYARYAGVPVALVNPVKSPKDPTLYAAILRIDDSGSENNSSENNRRENNKNNKNNKSDLQRSSLLSVVRAIIDNTPHSREVVIDDK